MTDAQVYGGAAVMGAVAGMRSMSSPAIISQLVRLGWLPVGESKLGFLGLPATAKTTMALAAGEFIADKLPFIPKRTTTGPLAARAISGGLAGAALCAAKKRAVLPGALIGALGAIGGAYAAYELRKRATAKFQVPDPVVAVIEDAVVAGCGALMVSALRRDRSELPARTA